MGIIQSVFCSATFCVERVLTWTCCAFLLMLLMFSVVMLMVYGISVGYHYAQKELAAFALSSRQLPTPSTWRRSGQDSKPVVRLLAVNRSEVEHAPHPLLDYSTCPVSTPCLNVVASRSMVKRGEFQVYGIKVYETKKPGENIYLETSQTPIIVLETERPPKEPELSPHERELARRLIGRFRRSRTNTTIRPTIPFLRPLRNTTATISYLST